MKTKFSSIALVVTLSGLPLWAGTPNVPSINPNPSEAGKIYDLRELTTAPKPLKQVQPLYPADLKAARVAGEVVVTFLVDTDGSVENPVVEKASEPAFGEAAIQALSAWQFAPGTKDGVPVRCRLILPLKFAISG